MENLIKIEIKDSFNKKDVSQKNTEDVLINASTFNNHKNISEISSMSSGSITASQFQNDFQFLSDKKDKNGFWRQILIGVISGSIGTIIGALSMYFIFGIK